MNGRATIYALCDSRVADPVLCIRYIGQTRIALEQRLRRHLVTALAGAREHRAVWMRAVKNAGGDVRILHLATVSSDESDATEIAQVARYRALGCDLTNRTDGGRGKRGWDVSEDTRQKMRESASQRRASAETRQRMSDAIKSSERHRQHLIRLHTHNQGARRTPEQRERISKSLRGDRNGQNVLTWESVAVIRERYAAGERQAQLVRDFLVSPATIPRVVHNVGWVQS